MLYWDVLGCLGCNPVSNTWYFGDALAAAVSSGFMDVVQLLLNRWHLDSRNCLCRARCMNAVEAAVDHEHIVVMLLDAKYPAAKFSYDDAVIRVLKVAYLLSTAALATLVQKIEEASKSGDLVEGIKGFQITKIQYPDKNLRHHSSAFSAAAKNNYPDIILYLCENQFPHFVTLRQWYTLFAAAQEGKGDMAVYLLLRGDNATIISARGRTPLKAAESNRNMDIVRLLEVHA
ncbi:hypothetical protein EJ02DRAFT_508860 [Clathrospora elynae]|uniref:Uncharacterized protein n=1 Tax=Clathrospora elynae TaxID=706981 RepID=A0A6A5T3R2_9PLEO|nr:hypothetical protein EJ02DRAFT_508860 [Clathrospora elynae]